MPHSCIYASAKIRDHDALPVARICWPITLDVWSLNLPTSAHAEDQCVFDFAICTRMFDDLLRRILMDLHANDDADSNDDREGK